MQSRRVVLSAKGWHVGELELSEWSTLWIQGCVICANGINTFTGKPQQPSSRSCLFITEAGTYVQTHSSTCVSIRQK